MPKADSICFRCHHPGHIESECDAEITLIQPAARELVALAAAMRPEWDHDILAAARAARASPPLRLVQQTGNDSLNGSSNGSLNKRATEAEAEADTPRT